MLTWPHVPSRLWGRGRNSAWGLHIHIDLGEALVVGRSRAAFRKAPYDRGRAAPQLPHPRDSRFGGEVRIAEQMVDETQAALAVFRIRAQSPREIGSRHGVRPRYDLVAGDRQSVDQDLIVDQDLTIGRLIAALPAQAQPVRRLLLQAQRLAGEETV